MVTAAELQALHQQSQQQQQQQHASVDAPLVDPFPAMREKDPFPVHVPNNGTANGHAGRSALAPVASPAAPSAPTATGQPDFSSQALFPALGASAPSAKGQWAQKPGSQRAVGSASTWSAAAPVIQRTFHQEALSIPSSEETSAKLGHIIQRVQNKHKDIKVEASTTRKLTTFVVKGTNEASVKAAKRELTVGLARHVSLVVIDLVYHIRQF